MEAQAVVQDLGYSPGKASAVGEQGINASLQNGFGRFGVCSRGGRSGQIRS